MSAASSGRRIGRYTLYGAIASGGLGTVHFATSSAAGGFRKVVAIKRLHEQFRTDRGFTTLFLEEARLSARIAHANVVQTLDAAYVDDEVLLVMEYVHGEALHRLLQASLRAGEPVPVAVAVAIVSGVLHGLEAAHDTADPEGRPLGIVHRDVSPQNIVVGVDGVARLLDFGIARAAGQSHVTREGQVKGKIGYMAPEQLQGEALTRQADIYACGVVLWELLTGTRLFVGDTEAVAMARVMDYMVPPPSELRADTPASLNRVVLRGLARTPSHRFASAGDMARALESAVVPASSAVVGGWVRRLADEPLRERAAARAACERAESVKPPAAKRSIVSLVVLGVLAAAGVTAASIALRSPRGVQPPPLAGVSAVEAAISAERSPGLASASAPVSTAPPASATPPASLSAMGPSLATGRGVKTKPGVPPAKQPVDLGCDPPYFVDSSGRKEFKRQCL